MKFEISIFVFLPGAFSFLLRSNIKRKSWRRFRRGGGGENETYQLLVAKQKNVLSSPYVVYSA
jgi:hypothetical protein